MNIIKGNLPHPVESQLNSKSGFVMQIFPSGD
jgi:hypothetical protein